MAIEVLHSANLIREAMDSVRPSTMTDLATLRARGIMGLSVRSTRTLDCAVDIVTDELRQMTHDALDVQDIFIGRRDAGGVTLAETSLVQISETEGNRISVRAHYLRSARADSEHYGLREPDSGRLLGYVCISPLDWALVRDALREIVGEDATLLNLSRMYVSRLAPRNTVSRMLRLVREALQARHGRWVLSTVVDPNLGFSGSSYRAAGWVHSFSIPHLGYLAVDGRQVTRRELIARYGTDDLLGLRDRIGSRLEASGPLSLDTLVFTCNAVRPQIHRSAPMRLNRGQGGDPA